jgi:hypothetical protein
MPIHTRCLIVIATSKVRGEQLKIRKHTTGKAKKNAVAPTGKCNLPFLKKGKFPKGQKKYDIRDLLEGFETISQVKEEREHRIDILQGGEEEHWYLAEILDACQIGLHCGSGACPVCRRLLRRWLFSEMMRIFEEGSNAMWVHIVPMGWAMTTTEMKSFSPKTMGDRLRQQLRREGFGGVIVGGIENDYHAELDLWLPHFHLVVSGSSREQMLKVRERFYRGYKEYRDGRRHIAIKIYDNISDPVEQFSYIYKGFWKRKDRRVRGRGFELKRDELLAALLTQGYWNVTQWLFMMGVRRRGGWLRVSA